MPPSVEVARRLADIFAVTVDYSSTTTPYLMPCKAEKCSAAGTSSSRSLPRDRERILFLVDGLIRDARTRQAYGAS